MEAEQPSSQSPEMDRLADEVVRGERSFLFPPGIASTIGAIFTTGFGAAFFLLNAAPITLGLAAPQEQSGTKLLCIQFGWIIPCVLGLMTAKGVPYASALWRRVVDVLLVGALLMLALKFEDDKLRDRFAVACALLFAAFLLLRSVGFAISVLFRQRVKARREAFFARQRAAIDEILKR